MTKANGLAFIAAALLAACSGGSTPSPVAKLLPRPKPAPVPTKRAPTVDELTEGMVEAVSLVKSTAQVGLKFQLSQRPALGQPLQLVLAVIPQAAADSATVQVAGSDGLQVAAEAASLQIPSIELGQVYKQSVTVTPTTEGVQLLSLTVALNHADGSESRTFSVPVIVAAPAQTAANPAGKR